MEHQLSAPASTPASAVAKRLWHIARVVFYMIRKGFTKHKLMMELNLLLKRSKIAGKALSNLMTFHHHNHQEGGGDGHRHHHTSSNLYSSLTCRYMDPNLAYYNPKEVEFSCSNSPSFPSFHASKTKNHQKWRRSNYELDAAIIAKAFEILNSENSDVESSSAMPSTSATPLWSIYEKSPLVGAARQLRITDSPFPAGEEEEGSDDVGQVDKKAEEFIRRFYEELQCQQRTSETPDNSHRRRRELITGRA